MARTTAAAEEEGAREGAVAEAADAAVAGARTSLCLEKVKKERVHLRVLIKIVFDSCNKEILKNDILCES